MSANTPPRFLVDFNELVERDLVLLARDDTTADADGSTIQLYEGLAISIFDYDLDADGKPDNLVANGVVERNRSQGWAKHVKWCCRINAEGILHESDIRSSSG